MTDVKRKLTQANSRVDDLTRDKERLMDQLSNTGKVVCPDNADQKAVNQEQCFGDQRGGAGVSTWNAGF